MRRKKFNVFAIAPFFLLVWMSGHPAFSQSSTLTLSCDSLMQDCDTVLAEYYDDHKLLLKKVRLAEENTIVTYEYNEQRQVIGKRHTNGKNQLLKYERLTLDSEGEWIIDTIFGKSDELLMILTRQRTTDPNVFRIQWYFKNELAPMTTQLVRMDENRNEISNSTCYSPDNCITTLNKYNNGTKNSVELWVLSPGLTQPELKETEELYYNEKGLLTLRIRYKEPEHTILERNKYLHYTGEDPLKRPTGR